MTKVMCGKKTAKIESALSHPSAKKLRKDGATRNSAGQQRRCPSFSLTGLHEAAADEVEGQLRGPFADAFTIAAKGAIDRVGALSVRNCDVDETDRFGIGCAGGAGDSCDAEAQGCAGPRADAFGQGLCDF